MSSPLSPDSLKRVTRIDPRTAWGHEARDFTPWLADHLEELAAAIGGLDLQLEGQEHAVGDFAADLVGTDLDTGAAFVIENQLADTDHGHLGQIVTYAAGLDAKVMVWVAPRIRDEHRQAVDWLNDISREEYAFFAVRVELLRIGAEVAPDFVVVAGPNAWQKRIQAARQANRDSGGGRGETYLEIWSELINRLKAVAPSLPPGRPQAQNWLRLRGGDIFMTFSGQGPRVEIYLDQADAKGIYDLLAMDKEAIEAAAGPLSWERLDGKQAARIAVYTEGSWTATGEERTQLIQWLIDNAVHFRNTLQPLVSDAKRRYIEGERAPADEEGEEPPLQVG